MLWARPAVNFYCTEVTCELQKLSNWISKQIKASKRLNPMITAYIIFLMASSSRKHTLTAAARFSDSSKSKYHYFLKDHSQIAVYALNELSKKQARQLKPFLNRENVEPGSSPAPRRRQNKNNLISW